MSKDSLMGAVPLARLPLMHSGWTDVVSRIPPGWAFAVGWAYNSPPPLRAQMPHLLLLSNGGGLYALARVADGEVSMVKAAADPEELLTLLTVGDRASLCPEGQCEMCHRHICNCLWSDTTKLEFEYESTVEGARHADSDDEPTDDDPYWGGPIWGRDDIGD